MITAVLNLHKGAGAAGEAVDKLRGGFLYREDVVDLYALRAADAKVFITRPDQFLAVTQHEIDIRHSRKGLWFRLHRAARDDDSGVGVGALLPANGLF